MTDGQGRTVDFKNTIIVMTSNMGQDVIRENLLQPTLTEEIIARTTVEVVEQMKHRVAPEFINRIDEVVMFLPLTRSEIKQVVELQLNSFAKKLEKREMNVSFDPTAVEYLTERSFIPEYGARPVKRAIDDCVVNLLSMKLLANEIDRTKPIVVRLVDNDLVFENAAQGGEA